MFWPWQMVTHEHSNMFELNNMGDEIFCIQLLKLHLLQPHDSNTNFINIQLNNFHP
jgi:hypothetical protein